MFENGDIGSNVGTNTIFRNDIMVCMRETTRNETKKNKKIYYVQISQQWCRIQKINRKGLPLARLPVERETLEAASEDEPSSEVCSESP